MNCLLKHCLNIDMGNSVRTILDLIRTVLDLFRSFLEQIQNMKELI